MKEILKMAKNRREIRKYNRTDALQSKKMLWLILLIGGIFLIVSSANVLAFDWTNGIHEYFKLDEGKGNTTGVLGTVANWSANSTATDHWGTGFFNNATRFNRTAGDYLITPLILGTNLTNWTISLWVNVTSDTSVGIIGQTEAYRYFLGTSGSLNFAFWLGEGSSWNKANNVACSSPVVKGQWYHLIWMRENTNLSLWINGTACASINTLTAGYEYFNKTLEIGKHTTDALNGMIDEIGVWNRSLTAAEITEIYNSGNGLAYATTYAPLINTYLISPTNNTLFSDVGGNFTINASIGGTTSWLFKNATFYIWNSTGIFNKTANTTFVGVSNQTTMFIDEFVLGNYKWNGLFCYGNATFNNCTWSNNGNYTYAAGVSLINISYNNETIETALETFSASFNTLPGQSIASIIFVYNGTVYPITNISMVGSVLNISKTIDIPLNKNPFLNETKYFYFNFTFGGAFTQQTNLYNQNVSFINLQLCNATYATTTLNFTVKNETVPLNSISPFFFGGGFSYWYGNGNSKKNYSIQNNSVLNEASLCIYPSYITLRTDANIDYSAAGFSQRSYYLRNAQINNVTNNITLYLLDDTLSKSVIINIKDKYLTALKNQFVKVLRYYPGLNSYYLVDTAKTDDFGNSLIKVQEEDVDYRINVEDSNGTQIYSSNPMRIICTSTPCQLEFVTGVAEHMIQKLIDYYNINYNLIWNNNTKYITFDYSDITGLTQSMRLFVSKITGYGEVTICDDTIEGASGILTCNVGNNTGEILARVYRVASPESPFATLTISLTDVWQNFGIEGLVWMFMFVVVMFFTGLMVGPPIAAILTFVSIVFMSITGFVYMPVVVLISIGVVVVILVIKMRS